MSKVDVLEEDETFEEFEMGADFYSLWIKSTSRVCLFLQRVLTQIAIIKLDLNGHGKVDREEVQDALALINSKKIYLERGDALATTKKEL